MSDDDAIRMVSARGRARRSGLGRGLFVLSGVLAVVGIVGAAMTPWSSLAEARRSIATRATSASPHRFLAPGTGTFDLPAGRIFVSYLTDSAFEDTRYMASAELVFDLTVTAADGTPVEVEQEVTQRANLPSSRPGRSATAVLVGAASIPIAGPHVVSLRLGEAEVGQAVAEVLIMDRREVEALENAFKPLLAAGCGFGGALFFAVFGGIAVWLEKRAGVG